MLTCNPNYTYKNIIYTNIYTYTLYKYIYKLYIHICVYIHIQIIFKTVGEGPHSLLWHQNSETDFSRDFPWATSVFLFLT